MGSWADLGGSIATFTAVLFSLYQSYKATVDAKKNKQEIYKQLEINKQNNFDVQGKIFKLQFCLQEFEKKDVLFETAVSDINVLMHSLAELDPVNVRNSARQLNNNLHELMHNAGSLQTIVRAANANDEKKYIYLLEKLKRSSAQVEETMNFLSQKASLNKAQLMKVDKEKIHIYFDDMVAMTSFILDQMHRTFRKM
ncbi:hypothetical protein FC81_GL001498 [Liquorilactobacillus capillatus DSM 19910]|uniref:Uncharacterized protein n=1 Tax=Liquorilactobacillus capillatus DSM 19910 TaxID=1423731 RepID=A0A0R1M147_9LACO|nr:hypothetical protein FC81_GL001498 [Liquorilactobacillus capillatus DSM 19910]